MTTTADTPNRPNESASAYRSEPGPTAVRAILIRVHFYAGLFVGPFILVAAATGLLYSLIPQLDNYVYRDYLTVERVGAERLPLSDQINAAATATDGSVTSIRPPARPVETTQVQFDVPDARQGYSETVFVDPYTGEVRGSLTTFGQWMPLRAWFDELHRNLHLGEVGRHYSELAASWLWVISVAGLMLWFSHRHKTNTLHRIATPDRHLRGRRRTLSWHGAVGVWIAVALFGLSATGITWSRYGGESVNLLQSALRTSAPDVDTALARPSQPNSADHHHSPDPGFPTSDTTQVAAQADTVLAATASAALSGPLWMYPPVAHNQGWRVAEKKRDWPTRYDAIAVDPETARVTDRVNFADWPALAKLTNWAIDAHMGVLFGVVNQVALALTAVGIISMVARGYVMWWQRRPTRGTRWALSRAPDRGAIRRLKPAGVIGLGLFTLTIGWFLPLFGLSLAIFLAVDLLLAVTKRRRRQQHAHSSRNTATAHPRQR